MCIDAKTTKKIREMITVHQDSSYLWTEEGTRMGRKGKGVSRDFYFLTWVVVTRVFAALLLY